MSLPVLSTDTDYEAFYRDYLVENKPCLFEAALTSGWTSRKEWVHPNGQINFDFLRKSFGYAVVPVADCGQRYYNSQPKSNMPFAEYLDYWENIIDKNYDYSTLKCLYLKDWHFMENFPRYQAYKVPIYFESDWLNEFWADRSDETDDYRFVYMGPKGTWTPLHKDVYGSFSWSVNICGRKKWILIAPQHESELKASTEDGNLPPDISSKYLTEDFQKQMNPIEVIQGPGEILFVPSGWLHQVANLEDTISINHNWYNACNLYFVWDYLQKTLKDIEKELSDIRGFCDNDTWAQECQKLLKAHHGTNLEDFVRTLEVVVNRLETELPQDSLMLFRIKHEILQIDRMLSDIFSTEFTAHFTERIHCLQRIIATLNWGVSQHL